jgi:hypothetical protein
VAKENLSLELQVQFVGVFLDAFKQLGCEGLGAEFFYEALVVYFAFNFPGCDDHFVVIFFSVRYSRVFSPSFRERLRLWIYAFSEA